MTTTCSSSSFPRVFVNNQGSEGQGVTTYSRRYPPAFSTAAVRYDGAYGTSRQRRGGGGSFGASSFHPSSCLFSRRRKQGGVKPTAAPFCYAGYLPPPWGRSFFFHGGVVDGGQCMTRPSPYSFFSPHLPGFFSPAQAKGRRTTCTPFPPVSFTPQKLQVFIFAAVEHTGVAYDSHATPHLSSYIVNLINVLNKL